MKKAIVLLIALGILAIPSVCLAEEPGLHGELTAMYCFNSSHFGEDQDQEWGVTVYYRFCKWLTVGTTETTLTGYSGRLIDYVPSYQIYDIYFTVDLFSVGTIRVGHFCKHQVISYNRYWVDPVVQADYIKLVYKW